VAVSVFVFCMRHGPVCFERLETLSDLMELDSFPFGSSEIFCIAVEALDLRGWIVE
jgi:hypothetical protein